MTCSPSTRAPPARAASSSTTRPHRRDGAARVPPDLPAARLGGARPPGDLGHAARHGAGGAGAVRLKARHRRHRHHQPARDHGAVEPRAPASRPQRHRLAGPARRARCAAVARAGPSRGRHGARPGCCVDAYFSGTKLKWLLDHVPGARAPAERGELAFGTVDSWLMWQLTGGAVHATDVSNASRTMLLNVHTNHLGRRTAGLLDVPVRCCPRVPSAAFGHPADLLGAAHADRRRGRRPAGALFGQACFRPAWRRTPTAPAASC